jgi:dihydroneopterin aldolase
MPAADRILLSDVAVEAIVGVHEHERHERRRLLVDLELVCEIADAVASDKLEDTVDYAAVVEQVRARCAETSYFLIEALAGEIARVCLTAPRVDSVKVTLKKPGAVEGASVAVALERHR